MIAIAVHKDVFVLQLFVLNQRSFECKLYICMHKSKHLQPNISRKNTFECKILLRCKLRKRLEHNIPKQNKTQYKAGESDHCPWRNITQLRGRICRSDVS